MGGFLKSFAIGAGAGIAVGICATAAARRSSAPAPPNDPADDALRIEPLLDRLDKMEAHLNASEKHRPPEHVHGELKRRIDEQGVELNALRKRLDETERRAASIAEQVEKNVADRISALENALGEQSASIGTLGSRAQETDANLQRLIAAIEKLVEKSAVPAPALLPFEKHLAEATERQAEPAEAPRPKSRFGLTRIFTALFVLVLPRLMQ